MKTEFDPSFDPPAPIGTVLIRNRTTGERSDEIKMLLDTGADVSLLPEDRIPASVLDSARFGTVRLTGFDGSSRSYRSIELQIVFRGKRFTGEFCLIDDDIGVLGRDVLNQVSILLDGPNLVWDVIESKNLPFSE